MNRLKQVSIALMVAIAVPLLVGSGFVQAAPEPSSYGRNLGENYYDGLNNSDNGTGMFRTSPDLPYSGIKPLWMLSDLTIDQFINEFQKRLYSTTDYNRGRAAAIILMMMGYNGNDAIMNGPSPERWRNGVSYAQAHFADWERLIRSYNAARRVDFNDHFNINGDRDWLGNRRNGNDTPEAFRVELANERNIRKDSVNFYDASGKLLFVLLKECANVTGESDPLVPLEPPTPTPVPRKYQVTPGISFQGAPASLEPGRTYTVNMTASYPPGDDVPDRFRMTGVPTVNTAGGVMGGVITWPNQSFASGSNSLSGPSFSVAIPANAANGSTVCFVNRLTPSDEKGSTADSPPACLGVYSAYAASIVGNGGDIHAGSDTCAADGIGTGNIIGGKANSYADYLISASGLFAGDPDGFGSYENVRNKAGRLGQNGNYYAVCRPNIYNDAKQTNLNTLGYTVVNDASASMAQLYAQDVANGQKGIVKVPNGFKLTGGTTGRYPLTIYSDEDVIITGSVRNISVGVRDGQASIGIVARNISVRAAATQVDAFMFADKKITTCDDAPTLCRNTLTVNGFIMANSFSLGRAGYVGGQVANIAGEIIKMNGQIYLNPPKLFEVAVGSGANPAQAQGERPARR